MPAPTHITVAGTQHKITPSQWALLVRAASNKITPGTSWGRRVLVQQLARKGLCPIPMSMDNYQKHEWGRPVATLWMLRPFPSTLDAVRALVAERRAGRDTEASNA